MDINDLLLTAVRGTIVYFFVLFVVRLLGKREIGNMGAFDLIVALMIGEVVDEAIYGDVSLAKGFTVIGTVAAWHIINSWASYKSEFIDKLTEASPTILIKDGVIDDKALAKERMNPDELWSQLRMAGVDDLSEIKQATLEPNGSVSVLLQDWAKPLQKSDLEKIRKKAA